MLVNLQKDSEAALWVMSQPQGSVMPRLYKRLCHCSEKDQRDH